MNNTRLGLRGSLLFEVLLVCTLLAIVLPLLIAPLWQLRERHQLALHYLDQARFHSALKAQLLAHWQRLLPAACAVDNELYLTIGSATTRPLRLSKRDMSAQSDWLAATDYGACRLPIELIQTPLTTQNHCALSNGDQVRISSCEGSVQAQVTLVNSQTLQFDLLENTLLGQAGVLENQMPFYWYVGEGKNGQQALWRTPQESGNSLELWSGLNALAVTPLLDQNNDGLVDTIDSRYGEYPLYKVRALWVEYLYQLDDCAQSLQGKVSQEYETLRGQRWRFVSPCQGVGNHIIVLNGFG